MLKSKIIDPFHGGRCLEAIYTIKDLTGVETSLLIYLGSQLNFKDFHHSKVTVSVNQISTAIKFKSSAIKSAIKSLSNKSYLMIENNFDEFGFKIENTYSISDYLFQCYVESKACQVVDSRETTMCQVVDSRETTSYLPSSIPEEIQSSKKKKNNKDQKSCVGRSPSLRQKDTHIINNLDDSFVPEENSNKIPIEKQSNPLQPLQTVKPIVTPQHNKMVSIFTPNPELRSYVKRNDILSITDHFISKHGDVALKAIDWLFDYVMERDLCGTAKWSIKHTKQAFNDALQHVLDEEVK